MKPTPGRVVFYTHDESDPLSLPGQQSPALIEGVNADGTVNLWVFGPTRISKEDGVSAGGPEADVKSPGTWTWPPRV